MDKRGKFEKMAEMMKGCCTREGDMADGCSMVRKMMEFGVREGGDEEEKGHRRTRIMCFSTLCHHPCTDYVIIKYKILCDSYPTYQSVQNSVDPGD